MSNSPICGILSMNKVQTEISSVPDNYTGTLYDVARQGSIALDNPHHYWKKTKIKTHLLRPK